MNHVRNLFFAALLLASPAAQAGSGTWLTDPIDSDWNNPANWSSNSIPDMATFAFSNVRQISITGDNAVLSITFNLGARPYTITALPGDSLSVGNGAGITNLSGVEQNFVAETDDAGRSGSFVFEFGGTINDGVTFTQNGASLPHVEGGSVYFTSTFNPGNAGLATLHNLGGTTAGASGGMAVFMFHGNAGESTIINEGAQVSGAFGGETLFDRNNPSAANATLIANGGSNGGGGGMITFVDGLGETCRVEVFGNGYMNMAAHSGPKLSVGSIEGDGQIYLGYATLMTGSNSLSTTFSGVLNPGQPSGGSGTGALAKVGSGTLTLSGANLYTDGTTVSGGTLVAANTSGSATGTGAVNVTAGTLGGSGIISGAVTIGTGSGAGAFLAPAVGLNKQLTLTIQGSLTFNSDSTYTYTFKAKGNRSKIDKVIANGVTINSGATINLSGTTQGQLTQGTMLTLIKNTAATPISGTFNNLPDGGIVNVNGNNLQADYEGGDGNDLTLTVVP